MLRNEGDRRALLFHALWISAVALIALSGCGKKPVAESPVVVTESWEHEPLEMVEPGTGGARGDIPAGEEAENVVSQQTFSHAGGNVGKVTNTSVPGGILGLGKRKTKVFTNCKNCHNATAEAKAAPLDLHFDTPAAPWWKWPAVAIGGALLAVFLWQFWPAVVTLIKFIRRWKK